MLQSNLISCFFYPWVLLNFLSTFAVRPLKSTETLISTMRHSILPPSLGILSFLVCKSSEFVQCYYPDGSIPTDYIYVACTNNAVSSCCIPSEGDICQDSGLCYYPPSGSLFRGACTDKTWDSSDCPQVCVAGKLTRTKAPKGSALYGYIC